MSTDTPAKPVPAKDLDAGKPAEETVAQKNARRSAESYLEFSGFSRSRLIYQLEFDGYPTEDATYAVDAICRHWTEQAVRAAESYLDSESHLLDSESYLGVSGVSRSRLIDQLKFDGFTEAQAEHAAKSVGL